MPSVKTLIFLHIMKTAGTTLERILKREYGESKAIRFDPKFLSCDVEEFSFLPKEERSRIKAIMGHFCFSLHKQLPGDYKYITILRDPVDRIMSEYFYILTQADHWFFQEMTSKHMSLSDFVRCGMYQSLDNAQTKYLSSMMDIPYGKYSSEAVEIAKDNLQKHFSMVGLTERFDESVILMKRMFHWRMPYYVRENVTKDRPTKETLSPEEYSTILEVARMDIELYETVKKDFETTVTQQDQSFREELNIFRMLNRRCGPFLSALTIENADFKKIEMVLFLDTLVDCIRKGNHLSTLELWKYGQKTFPDSPELQEISRYLETQRSKFSSGNSTSRSQAILY